MSDYPKYRLKKDTPEFEAGQMFTRGRDEYDNDCLFAGGAPLAAFDVSLIDNFDEWFEVAKEPKKEPMWVRKQIKQIEFGKHKLVWVVVRFIKNQSYICYDNELGDTIDCNEPGEIRRINFHADDSGYWRQKDYDILNQMVRDGYIEIEDNPNIVWEDEDD